MAKKTYKLNNENKLNNKSELQSKSDSVVLTNYKKLEDNFFIEEKNQEIKDTISSGSIDQILIREKEMIKKLEDLKLLREQLATELKHSLEIYEMLKKIREAEKKEFEKVYKNALNLQLVVFDDSYVKELQEKLKKEKKFLEQSREQIENEQKHSLEIYKMLKKIREFDKNKLLEKVYTTKNALNLPLVVFDNSYVKELQSKNDSVGLTNYKNLDDNFFIEDKNQEIKYTILLASIDQILIRENEMIKKLENLKQLREQLATELKHSLEIYEMLEKIREAEKKEFEKVYKNALNLQLVVFDDSYVKELQEKLEKETKNLEQSREKLEAEQKNLSEMYTKLEKLQEVDKNKLLEKEYENVLNLPLVVFDDSYVKELQEKLEKEKKVLEQSREKLEAEQKNLSEMYTKLEKLQEVDKNKLLEKEYENVLNLPLVVFDDSYVKELQEKLEKEKKVLEQSREKLEAEQKNLSEMYTKLEKLQEVDKDKLLEKKYRDFSISSESDSYEEAHDVWHLLNTSYNNHRFSPSSSQFEYDSLSEEEELERQ